MRSDNRKIRLGLLNLLIVLLIGITGTALAAEPANFNEALAQAAEQDKVLVLDFFTEW
jgi:hypothetical protein